MAQWLPILSVCAPGFQVCALAGLSALSGRAVDQKNRCRGAALMWMALRHRM